MFDEKRFREVCSEFYKSNSPFLSSLLIKISESFSNNGIIENVLPEEESVLLEIGYEKKNNQFAIDSEYIKVMMQCQKEERRNYHLSHQKQLRSLFFKCLQKEFRSKGVIEVVVDKKENINNTTVKILTKEEKVNKLESFCLICMKTESGKLILGEILKYFQKQLKSAFVCELIINDAEFINEGEDFIKEAMFVFCSVLGLIPHVGDDDLPENVSSELQFKDRPWSLGSIIEDGILKDWINIIMKHKKQVDYAIIKETNVKCIHQRIRKQIQFKVEKRKTTLNHLIPSF